MLAGEAGALAPPLAGLGGARPRHCSGFLLGGAGGLALRSSSPNPGPLFWGGTWGVIVTPGGMLCPWGAQAGSLSA